MEAISLTGPPPIQETPESAFTLSIPNLSLMRPEKKEESSNDIVVNSPSVPVPPIPENQSSAGIQMLRIPKIQFDSQSTEKLDAPSSAGIQESPLKHSDQ